MRLICALLGCLLLPLALLPPASPLCLAPHLRTKIASQAARSERRAAERSRTPRATCPGCARPPVLCVCEALPRSRIRCATRVVVLQHPREFRRRSLSTAPLLPKVLERCTVVVGYSFAALPEPLRDYVEGGGRPLLLYPGAGAISLDEGGGELPGAALAAPGGGGGAPEGGRVLVLIDGTWGEAARMVRSSPALVSRCARVQFASEAASIYEGLRKEPEAHCLSTLEACARALVLLEPGAGPAKEAREYLEGAMRCLVAKMMERNAREPRFQRPGTRAEGRRRVVEEFEEKLFSSPGGSSPTPPGLPRDLGGGATLRHLTLADCAWVDARWEHSSATSLSRIHRLVAEPRRATLGVERGGALVASALQGEDGALGMLHVAEAHRRRGYGEALVAEAAGMIKAGGVRTFAYVLDGNFASEALFAKLGWVRADSSIPRRTGRRRAKRLWTLD
jgi:DTW domain-containing protein YfiP/ribosomal protein S18 acetylase RimI-like enzyme